MSISDQAINEIITKFGAVLTHSSGHNKTSPTLIYTFPTHGGYQLAIRRNKNELTVYLNAKTRTGKSCEQFIESSSIKKSYPNDEGINPSNSLLNTDHAPYLTPKRHKLLLVKVAPSDFSELIAKYLDVQAVSSDSSKVISDNILYEKPLKHNEILTNRMDDSVLRLQEALNNITYEIESEYKNKPGGDVDAIVKRRVGQSEFRSLLEEIYGASCHLTNVNKARLLIASHIVPWSKSTSEEKTDPENGLLLSISWDAVFDKGFICFDEQGKVIFSDELDSETIFQLGLDRNKQLSEFILTSKRKSYLMRHKNEIFERWKKLD